MTAFAITNPNFLTLGLSKGLEAGSGDEFARTLRRCSG
jgi:hypothetical protein